MSNSITILIGIGVPFLFLMFVILGAILDNIIHIRKHLIKEKAELLICSGCGALSTEKSDKPCCPDSRYISIEQFRDEWRDQNRDLYDGAFLVNWLNDRMVDPDKNTDRLLEVLSKQGIHFSDEEICWYYEVRNSVNHKNK